MPNTPIGNFSKRTLLTGAGWSHNWDLPLAKGIWEALMGHEAVQGNARLRTLLLEESSFELALGKTHAPPYTTRDRRELELALLDVFIAMDRDFERPHQELGIDIYDVQKFLFRFWGLQGDSYDTGYLFTLNQDLFFERKLFNAHVSPAPDPSLPGLQARPNRRWFNGSPGPYSDDFIVQPIADKEQWHLRGQMNVVKLHGSVNWRTGDGSNVMVVGTAKSAQITSLPLLRWYTDIFNQVLTAGDVRLLIMGYGFGDEHINEIIAGAVKNHGLKVLIWDTGGDLKDRVHAAPHGAIIWNGLLTTATRPMNEVFPNNSEETGAYRRIKDAFFV